jgi:hypothetical protein
MMAYCRTFTGWEIPGKPYSALFNQFASNALNRARDLGSLLWAWHTVAPLTPGALSPVSARSVYVRADF